MSDSILLLGGTGYIGEAFQRELARRGAAFTALSRAQLDYTRFEPFLAYLREKKPAFVVNAAGYTGKPNVDACEAARAETLAGNVLLPVTVAHACAVAGIPWGHVSSGCIYSGAHVMSGDTTRTERDLMRPEIRAVWEKDRSVLRGFTEEDVPNFSFTHPPCSFYSGTKALGEEAIRGIGNSYIWRLRIPFDENDSPRNYLTKMQRYPKLLQSANSVSHRADFVRACLDLWDRRAPFGIYNVTNPGWVTTSDVVAAIKKWLGLEREFQFFEDDADFYAKAAITPRSNCLMDSSKLIKAGVSMRPVAEALEDSLRNWKA